MAASSRTRRRAAIAVLLATALIAGEFRP